VCVGATTVPLGEALAKLSVDQQSAVIKVVIDRDRGPKRGNRKEA
jgi:hypothetical protein